MSNTSVNVLPRALNNAPDIRLIVKLKAPGEKLAFHPVMVSHVASPIDPPIVKRSGGRSPECLLGEAAEPPCFDVFDP